MTPDEDVATALQTAGRGTIGTDLFTCPEEMVTDEVPDACIFCISSGGPSPMPFFDSANGYSLYEANVQIIVRGARNTKNTVLPLARNIIDDLHRATISGYVGCLVMESEPNFLGFDDDRHIRYSVNARLWKVQ